MGLPSVVINFKEKAATAIKRGQRGIVVLILNQSNEPNISATVNQTNTGLTKSSDIKINIDTFGNKAINEGEYEFSYSKTDTSWKLKEESVDIAEYGIIVSGTVDDGDTFQVIYSQIRGQAIYDLTAATDIEASMNLTDRQKKYVELVFSGYINPPKRVYLAMRASNATDYVEIEKTLESFRWDYLTIPEIQEADVAGIATWLKSTGKRSKAVLPKCNGDSERIINFTSEGMKTVDGYEYTTAEYCARIAGAIAGTPLDISCTYASLPELIDFKRISTADMNQAIDRGELILYHDGEKVKIARGVNSLTTTTQDKGESFKKIKIIEAIDLIHDDIKKTSEDSYLGKYANNYDNKCLLLSAINNYFDQLAIDGVLDKDSINKADIDLEAQRNFLKSIGLDVSDMTEMEVKKANTKDKVFLKANVKILDAIEDITLNIYI